jgi:hypothetical protein
MTISAYFVTFTIDIRLQMYVYTYSELFRIYDLMYMYNPLQMVISQYRRDLPGVFRAPAML